MNYIFEINSFYNWVMLNPLPADAQALWHVLMQMNNRSSVNVDGVWYRRVEFAVPNSMVLSILAFSRQQLDRMRNILIQTGRIVYKKGKGNQSGIYRMIPFDTTLSEAFVGDFPEKLWICTNDEQSNRVSHNVTQSEAVSHNVTQNPEIAFVSHNVTQFDTQTGHKLIHKSGTNADLCHIMSTYIKNNKNKNIYKYNNIYNCDGDDDNACARVRVCDTGEIVGNSAGNSIEISTGNSNTPFLPEFDCYFGMTDDIKHQAATVTKALFAKYFTRQPSRQDILNVFEAIRGNDVDGNVTIDENKVGLLEYAFNRSSLSGNCNWAYVNGILINLRQRGLKNADDCEKYDLDREFSKYGY